MLAGIIDASSVRHTDPRVEIALPTGTIGSRKISNDSSGFAELLAWIGDRGRSRVVGSSKAPAARSGWPARSPPPA